MEVVIGLILASIAFVSTLAWLRYTENRKKKRSMDSILSVTLSKDITKMITSRKSRITGRSHTCNQAVLFDRLLIMCSEQYLIFAFVINNHEYEHIGYVPLDKVEHTLTIEFQKEVLKTNNYVCGATLGLYSQIYIHDDVEVPEITIDIRCDDSIDIKGLMMHNKPVFVPVVDQYVETTTLGYAMCNKPTIHAKFGLLDHKMYYKIKGNYMYSDRPLGVFK